MKQLLLLLTIPTLSYSQITFEDIMSINSEDTFNRVMIEGGYEDIESCDKTIYYGIHTQNISSDFEFDELVPYFKLTGEFKFSFGENKNYDYSFYDEIINTIKNNCTFYVH